MFVAFQLLFMVKISCGTFTHDNKSETIYSKQPNPLKDLTHGYMFYGDGPHMYIEFSLSGQLNILICFVISAQSLVLFQQCESKDKLPQFWSNSKLFSHYCGVTDNNVKLNQFLKMFLTAMTLNCA